MKVAVIGSRDIYIPNIGSYLPGDCTEIVSGGARGVDRCAESYAKDAGLKLKLFLPDYDSFGRKAPLIRNREIVDYADCVIAFWNGTSNGTRYVINYCRQVGKPCTVIYV